jgi:hypothetical protein
MRVIVAAVLSEAGVIAVLLAAIAIYSAERRFSEPAARGRRLAT